MAGLTKEQFIAIAEGNFGYESYKDLLEELGYSKRYLDRYTYETELRETFLTAFSEWKAKHPSTVEEEVQVEQKKPKKAEDIESQPKEQVVEKEVDVPVVAKNPLNDKIGFTVTNKAYHESDNLSASRIKMVLENAREFYEVYVSGNAKKSYTDALLVGSLHHTLVLEPENFDRDYIVLGLDNPLKNDLVEAIERLGGDIDRKANSKGESVVNDTVPMLKSKLDELRRKETRTIVTSKQVELAQKTAEKALNSWYVIEANGKTLLKAQLKDVIGLESSFVERTFYGEIGGVKVQVRPDLLMNLGKNKPVWFCVDLKTAEDATMAMFAKQSARFFYDLQEWVYREVLRQNNINVVDFRFHVSGKSDRSDSAYYKVFSEDVQDAGRVVEKAIEKYKFCLEHNIWQEGKFDFDKMKFDDVTTVRIPTYRQFQLIDMGAMQ